MSKDLINYLNNGSFKQAYELISSSKNVKLLKGKYLDRLLSTIARNVEKNNDEIDYLLRLLKLLECDAEVNITTYLKSLNVIVQHLIKQKTPGKCVELEHLLTSSHINKCDTSIAPIYNYTRSGLTNAVTCLNSDTQTHLFLNYITMVTRMYKKFESSNPFPPVKYFISVFINTNMDPSKIKLLGNYCLEAFDILSEEENMDKFSVNDFIQIVSWLVYHFIKSDPMLVLRLLKSLKKFYRSDIKEFYRQIGFIIAILENKSDIDVCSFKDVDNNLKDSPRFYEFLYQVLDWVYRWYIKTNFHINYKSILKLHQLVFELCPKIMKQTNGCCDKCDYNFVTYSNLLATDILILSQYLKKEIPCDGSLRSTLFDILVKWGEEVVKFKAFNCRKYKTCEYIVYHTFNIIVVCYQNKKLKDWLKFVRELIRIIYKFGVDEKMMQICRHIFEMLICTLNADNLYEESLNYTAWCFYLFPENRKKFGEFWTYLTQKLKRNNTTIMAVLKDSIAFIQRISVDFKVPEDKQIIKTLIYDELDCYHTSSCYTSMYHAFTELSNFTTSLELAQKMFEMDIPKLLSLNNDFLKIVDQCLKNLNKNTNKFLYGFLSYLKYKYDLFASYKATREEIAASVEAPVDEEKILRQPDFVTSSTDITPVFTKLDMNYCKEKYQRLLKVLFYVQTYSGNVNRHHVKFAIEIAIEFCLNCFLEDSIKAWHIAFKFAEKTNDANDIVFTASFIMKHLDVSCTLFEQFKNTCESFVNDEKVDNPTLLIYYTNICHAYLECQKITKYRECYDRAYAIDATFDDITMNTYKSNIYLAQCYFAASEVNLYHIPCASNVHNHESIMIVKPIRAFQNLYGYIKQFRQTSTFHLMVFFEVARSMCANFCWLHLPREIVYYSRPTLRIAQEYEFAFHAAQFLRYLAYADSLYCEPEACHIKLLGMGHILGLQRNAIDDIVDGINGIHLAVPIRRIESGSGSPTVFSENILLPEFISHKSDCKCFYCISYEYQKLVLQYYYMNALYHESIKVDNLDNWYKSISKVFDHIRHYNIDASFPFKARINYRHFHEHYSTCMLELAKHYIRVNRWSKAEILVERLNKDVVNDKKWKKNAHLIDEIHNLQLALEHKPTKKSKTSSNHLAPPVNIGGESPRTPENKITSVAIAATTCVKDYFDTVKPEVVPIKFEVTPCATSGKSPVLQAKHFNVPETPKIPNKLDALITPLEVQSCKKFNVFKDGAANVRVTRSRRKLLQEEETVPKTIKTRSRKK